MKNKHQVIYAKEVHIDKKLKVKYKIKKHH